MAFASGIAFPYGNATGEPGDRFARRYSYQIPLLLELGGRFHKSFYLGGYLGFGFGAEGDDPQIEDYCDDNDSDWENDVSCTSVSLSLGAEARYGFSPDAMWNPWLSAGAGLEAVHQSIRDTERGYSEETFSSGQTFAKLGVGVDYRGAAVGFGPMAQVSVGRFDQSSTSLNGDLLHRGAISDPAWHGWAMLGIRWVISP